MSYGKFRNELINDSKECMFEQVTSVMITDNQLEDNRDERLLRQAIDCIRDANIVHDDGDKYSIVIHCKKGINKIGACIYPLYYPKVIQTLNNEVTFTEVLLPLLSEFFVLTVGDIKRVIKIECHNMPVAERDKAVFRSIINTKSKFINYLSFMLSDDAEQFIAENDQLRKDLFLSDDSSKDDALSISLYEDMVRMAYRWPERIGSIRQVIEKADEKVIPQHFIEMYEQFERAIKKTKRYGY
jgi:hypothetical protein